MGDVVRLPRSRRDQKQSKSDPVKLTKRVVEAIRPQAGRDVVVFDAQLPGFCVRVKPSGVRSYAIQYRNERGRSCRMTVGRHGILTAEEARNEARQRLADAKRGTDPLAERRDLVARAAAAKTVSQLMERYLTDYAEQRKKPSSIREDRRLIDKRINPEIGKKRLDELSRDDVVALHHGLRKSPYEANRTLSLLSKALNLAELWGLRPQGSNPCRFIERYHEKARQRFFSDAELKAIGKALREAEQARTESPGVILAIRLLALTGCRLQEVLTLRWQDVDLAAGVLRLPDAKAGARLVPLGAPALALLRDAQRDGRLVVQHTELDRTVPISTIEGAWKRVREKAGLEDARLHDLRRTVGTYAGQHGWNAFTVKAVMGHKTLAMTDRYVAHDTAPMRRAAEDVSRRILEALTDESE